MKKIKLNGEVVAIFHKTSEWNEGLDFLTPDCTFIQTGTWWYNKGKELKAHRHILNERNISLTQETIVILSGKLRVDLYDETKTIFHQEILVMGEIGVILNCGHGYFVLENDTKVVEVKNGPFFSVEKDKVLL